MGSIVKTLGSKVNSVNNANYTITDIDGFSTILVTTGASQRTINLPTPSTNAGREITIKKVDGGAGTVLIDTPGSEMIDGAANNVLNAQYSFVKLACDGSNWSVMAVHDFRTGTVSSGSQSANTYVDNTSTSIPPGRWSVTWTTGFNQGGSTIGYGMIFISTSSGNTAGTASVSTGDMIYISSTPTGTIHQDVALCLNISVAVTSSTTYYFKSRCAASGNVSFLGGTWKIERLR